MGNLIIIGAGGQSQTVLEVLLLNNEYNVVGYIDENSALHGKVIRGYKVLGDFKWLVDNHKEMNITNAIIAIGDNNSRKNYMDKLGTLQINLANAIHPTSIISSESYIGDGVFIGAGVIIGPFCEIGRNTIINAGAVLPHYNKIDENVNISPNVSLGGGTRIAENCFVGIGSTLIQYINIGQNVIIGAGSVVINDIQNNSLVVGVPGKVIKTLE